MNGNLGNMNRGIGDMLRGKRIGVIGGDAREIELVKTLVGMGCIVKGLGFPESAEIPGDVWVKSPEEAVEGADAVIAPLPGTDGEGNIRITTTPIRLTESLFGLFKPGALLLIGSAKPIVRELAAKKGVRIIETADDDELAILNSIPTAEGAIQMAMELSPYTIHGSTIIVLGFGRTGLTLAHTCRGLGATVIAAARKPRDMARITALGLTPLHFDDLRSRLGEADIVFNTAPALVLDRELLKLMSKGAIVIDLASPPGGVDFTAAEEFGIKAILAPGLPGKVAPKSAGKILGMVIPRLIAENL